MNITKRQAKYRRSSNGKDRPEERSLIPMNEIQRKAKIMVLKDMIKEYKLLAKYNGGTDYDKYCALEFAVRELEKKGDKSE